MADGRVVLYEEKTRGGSWIVDAEVNPNGGISICSGDGSAEWYAIIDQSAKLALRESLRAHLHISSPTGPNIDDEILELLVRAFSTGSLFGRGPYRDIRRFLDKNDIPWRSDFWGSL